MAGGRFVRAACRVVLMIGAAATVAACSHEKGACMDDNDCATAELFCFQSLCEEACFSSFGDGEVGSPCSENAACKSERCDKADRFSSCECLPGTGGTGGSQMGCPDDTEPRIFFDDTFLDTEWTDELVEGQSRGSDNSFMASQETTGGNPGAYRGMTLTLGEGDVVLWQLNLKNKETNKATWNPADGRICGLSAQLDGTDKDAQTAQTIYSMALKQGGKVFWSDRFFVNVEGWFTMPLETEFKQFDPPDDPDATPNFMTGEIEFGFLAGASKPNGAPRELNYGVDNWRFVVCLCSPQ